MGGGAYLRGSSFQSISEPMMLNNAFESMTTFTPSCSTTSSNFAGLSTYSKWYERPAQPLLRTPMRRSWGVGLLLSVRSLSNALEV